MSDGPALPGGIDAIVIGCSAGGVEALCTLLPALPAGLRAAVFVVLHLPRERPSLLVSVFQRHSALPVREAEDKEAVEPGVVYLAPPDYHLLIERGPFGAVSLALSADPAVNYSRPSIDVMFESAVDAYGARVLGIVLTGANQDGAQGLAAIAAAGGVTIVQDPAGAQTPYMPEAALKRAPASRVLPLDEIAAQLGTLLAHAADGRSHGASPSSPRESR